ncbi:MAG: tetratricopeptide repeat protein [Myxococcales bacterium]|nr:tetratricopeptide repeat protein [Myxococcales bacterium]
MTGSRSRVVALAAVGGCFLAFWAPATAQGPTSPAEEAAPGGPEAGPLDPADDSSVESDTGQVSQAQGSDPVAPLDSATDLSRTAAAVRLAWWAEAEDSVARTRRTRRAALQHGMRNFDPAARLLIGPELNGAGLEQAQAAVTLSPDLPAARMALAWETWLEGDSPITAVRTVFGALFAISRHLESSIWFSATTLTICALALIAGGFLTLVIFGVFAFLHAAHDIGDLIPSAMPTFARAALLGSVMLVPLVLQQGLLGLALPLFAIALLYGAARQRLVLCLAAIAVLIGAFPMARLTGRLLTAYVDTSIEAAVLATDGFALPGEPRLLESVAESDPIAAMALAVMSRRAGNLAEADARYRRLLQQEPANYAAANNAANVKLELGQLESAISLYRRSLEMDDSATVLFNLFQAQGQGFKLDDVGPTLAAAQRLDSERIAELTLLQGSDLAGFTVDLPLPRRMLWDRILAARSGETFATGLRSLIAPGALGQSARFSAGAFASIAILSLAGASRWKRSHWCGRCGRTMCPRCEPELGGEEDCGSCNRLFQHPETTARVMRAVRVSALRSRERRLARVHLIASIVLPGVAGALARCPWASFIGALSAAIATLAIYWRNGVTPDPLTAGAAAPMAFGLISALALFCYSASVIFSLAARSRS